MFREVIPLVWILQFNHWKTGCSQSREILVREHLLLHFCRITAALNECEVEMKGSKCSTNMLVCSLCLRFKTQSLHNTFIITSCVQSRQGHTCLITPLQRLEKKLSKFAFSFCFLYFITPPFKRKLCLSTAFDLLYFIHLTHRGILFQTSCKVIFIYSEKDSLFASFYEVCENKVSNLRDPKTF